MSVPTLTLEAGFEAGAPYAYYDVSHYDDGSEYAPDVIQHDISAYARDANWSTSRGVSQIVTTGFGANAGTFDGTLANLDRRFDPNNTAGPYVEAGIVKVIPDVPIAYTATYAATTYPLFTGAADDWPQQYPMFGHDQTIPLKATDATRIFAGASLSISRPAEYSGARIAAIVTACGWTGATAISHGNTIVSALTSGTVSAWSHMLDVANAEWGDLYIANDGTFTFRDRDLIFSENRSTTSQATFGDAGSELRYSDVQMGSPPILNDVTVRLDTGAEYRSQSVASQRLLAGGRGRNHKSLVIPLPIRDGPVAQQYADWLVQRYAFPLTTFVSIEIKPASDPTHLWAQAFGRELGDRVTVKRTPLGGGSRIVKDCFIRGIRHSYTGPAGGKVNGSTVFTLQDASWTATIARYDVSHYDDGSVYAL